MSNKKLFLSFISNWEINSNEVRSFLEYFQNSNLPFQLVDFPSNLYKTSEKLTEDNLSFTAQCQLPNNTLSKIIVSLITSEENLNILTFELGENQVIDYLLGKFATDNNITWLRDLMAVGGRMMGTKCVQLSLEERANQTIQSQLEDGFLYLEEIPLMLWTSAFLSPQIENLKDNFWRTEFQWDGAWLLVQNKLPREDYDRPSSSVWIEEGEIMRYFLIPDNIILAEGDTIVRNIEDKSIEVDEKVIARFEVSEETAKLHTQNQIQNSIATSIEGGADFATDIGTRLATGQEITPAVLGISASGSLLSAAAGNALGAGLNSQISRRASKPDINIESPTIVNNPNNTTPTTGDRTLTKTNPVASDRSITTPTTGDRPSKITDSTLRDNSTGDRTNNTTAQNSDRLFSLSKDKNTIQTSKSPGEFTNRKTESEATTNKALVDINNTTKDKDNVNLFENHPNRARNLEIALRGNEKVPVVKDSSLEGNTVQVHYIVDKNGLVDPNSIHIKAGPSARNIDVMLHARTVSRLKRYSGLLGEVIKLKNQIKKLLDWRTPEIGSLAWEAMLEVDKLEQIIKHLMKQRTLGVDIQLSSDFDDEIANLSAQLAQHKRWYRTVRFVVTRSF